MITLKDAFAVFGLVLLGGGFSLFQTALPSCRKSLLRLRSESEDGGRRYKAALEAAENPGSLLPALGIWAVLCRISAAILAALVLLKDGDSGLAAAFLTALALTLLVIIFGSFLPKQIAASAPERIAASLLPLFRALALPALPLAALGGKAACLWRRFFKIEAGENAMTEEELRAALAAGEESGIVESRERTMVEGVFYLGDRPVETFMTHRSEIEWLDIEAGPEEARKTALAFRSQGFFPVAPGTLDEVAGVVSVQDILMALLEKTWPGLRPIMTPPRFIPETMSALKAFEAFKREEADFLCVMDEYGGFAGSLKVRDLFEAIVGDLSPSAAAETGMQSLADGGYLAEGSANIDEIGKALSIVELLGEHLEYHTLAGFILSLAGEIPKTGEDFLWNGWRFKISAMDGNRIDKVLIYSP